MITQINAQVADTSSHSNRVNHHVISKPKFSRLSIAHHRTHSHTSSTYSTHHEKKTKYLYYLFTCEMTTDKQLQSIHVRFKLKYFKLI